jgi:hypothetical protein
MRPAFYVINQSLGECKVFGKFYEVQFGHHVKSLQHSNLSIVLTIPSFVKICQVTSIINMHTDRHIDTLSPLINFKHICITTTISSMAK